MATLTNLKTWRDQLEKALGTGVLSVTVDGVTTTFDNVDGLRSRLRYVSEEIGRLTGVQSRPRAATIDLSGGV